MPEKAANVMSDNTNGVRDANHLRYEYTDRDVFGHPNHYMYSQYFGAAFLAAYENDRNECCAKWREECPEAIATATVWLWPEGMGSPTRSQVAGLLQYIGDCGIDGDGTSEIATVVSGGAIKTGALLADMLCWQGIHWPVPDAAYAQCISGLCRKFETRRLLAAGYAPEFGCAVGATDVLTVYARFAFLLALELARTEEIGARLALMNALLKTGDVLSAARTGLTAAQDAMAAWCAVQLELRSVRALRPPCC